jgi:hypothetical protein
MTEYADVLTRLSGALSAREDTDALREELFAAYLAGRAASLFGGTTPAGLPWPAPTDPVAAGADAIRALAEAVDPTVRNNDQYLILNGATAVTLGAGAWSSISWPTVEKQKGTDVTQSGNGFVLNAGGVFGISVMLTWTTALNGNFSMGIGPSAGSGPDALYRASMPTPAAGLTLTAYWERPVNAGTALSLFVIQNGTGTQTIGGRRLSIRRLSNYP